MCVAGEKVEVFFFPPKNYEMRLGRWWRGDEVGRDLTTKIGRASCRERVYSNV